MWLQNGVHKPYDTCEDVNSMIFANKCLITIQKKWLETLRHMWGCNLYGLAPHKARPLCPNPNCTTKLSPKDFDDIVAAVLKCKSSLTKYKIKPSKATIFAARVEHWPKNGNLMTEIWIFRSNTLIDHFNCELVFCSNNYDHDDDTI